MKSTIHIYIILLLGLAAAVTACNDDVFVTLPPEDIPGPGPTPPDDPEPEPVYTDSLVLLAFDYIDGSITLTDDYWEQDGVSIFYNHGVEGPMTISLDNYNATMVSIYNSTHYVIPWAKEGQMLIGIPYYDAATSDVTILQDFIPFKFGLTSIRGQLMGAGTSSLTIPANTKVRATVYTTRRKITARAQIMYKSTDWVNTSEIGWADVVVWQPVDIRVEWSDILPIEETD